MKFTVRVGEVVGKYVDIKSTQGVSISAAPRGRRTLDVSGDFRSILHFINIVTNASRCLVATGRTRAALRKASASMHNQMYELRKRTMCSGCGHPHGAHRVHESRDIPTCCLAGDVDVDRQFNIVGQDDRCTCTSFYHVE